MQTYIFNMLYKSCINVYVKTDRELICLCTTNAIWECQENVHMLAYIYK